VLTDALHQAVMVNLIEASINTLPILTTFRKRSPLRVHITLFMGDHWRLWGASIGITAFIFS
jgi:hypothetical protein